MAAPLTEIEMEKRQKEAVVPQSTTVGPSTAPVPVSSPQEQGVTPTSDTQGAPMPSPQQTQQPPYYEPKQQPPGHAQCPTMVPMVVPLQMLQGEAPQYIDCPFCHQRTLTSVRREGNSMQMLTGVVLCLLCVCLAFLPCCAGWFEDTLYSCSSCDKVVAKRLDDGGIEVYGPTVVVPSQHPK